MQKETFWFKSRIQMYLNTKFKINTELLSRENILFDDYYPCNQQDFWVSQVRHWAIPEIRCTPPKEDMGM